MDNKRFFGISEYYRERFGRRVYKLALDIDATCPNRDGKIGTSGCIFCSSRGSGDFASLDMQIDRAIERLGAKATGAYIAYFQSFTNTYMPVDRLDRYVNIALAHGDILGLAISTRPDCIDGQMLDYLTKLSSRTHLVIELGLQSSNDRTLEMCNRGHSVADFDRCYRRLFARNIKVCVHIMDGLPGESRDDMLGTARYVATLRPFAVKIHNTYVVENTVLGDMYMRGEYAPLEMERYMDILIEQIRILPTDICVERVTGDGDRHTLLAPEWILHKRYFLNSLDRRMAELGARQGDMCSK